MNRILTFLISLTALGSFSQSPAAWWYFGQKAGVHFTTSGPVADTNGELTTFEGCASISDVQGNLLFYTDGTRVYNIQHQIMPNGSDLLGNSSSTQSAIIVPKPGDATKYYVFTSAASESVGLTYSLVDMNLDGGLGDVDVNEKNITLLTRTRENIAAVSHSNNQDFWVTTHKYKSDTVAAFRVSNSGVNTTPVLSQTGDSIWAVVGSLKGSPNGKLLAFGNGYGNSGLDEIKLMKFNRSTGEIIESTLLGSNQLLSAYGIEFSPNSELMYVSDGWTTQNGRIAQYDVSVFDSTAIVASEFIVVDSVSFGQIQLGPDGKIYVSSRLTFQVGIDSFLHRINDPNVQGMGCNFELDAVYLEGRTATMGLPPFITSFFYVGIEFTNQCFGDTVVFSMDTANVDSAIWNFGDPSTGALNTSQLYFPAHIYSDTGNFQVVLTIFRDTLSASDTSYIYIYPRQSVNLGPDDTLCFGDTVTLSAKQPFSTFLWQDSTTNDTMVVTDDSTLWVTVFGVCDTVSDTVSFLFDRPILFDFGPDTALCEGQSKFLDANLQVRTDTFFWNTADSTDTLLAKTTGMYRFTAANACGIVTDSVAITFIPVPNPTLLPPDTLNCFDNEIVVSRPALDSVTYVWQDSTAKLFQEVDTTATLWLAAFNSCGFSVDTMHLIFNGQPYVELGDDTIICPDDSIDLNVSWPGATYLWGNAILDSVKTDTMVRVNEEALYIVTITYGLCEYVESKRIIHDPLFCPTIDCALQHANVMTPNADGLNDRFRAWSDCDIRSYEMFIYNRWGQLVHHSDNASFGWDGYVNEVLAPEGVYFFQIDFKDRVVVDEDRNVYQGSFTLIRE